MKAYPQMREPDILFKDWEWVKTHHKLLDQKERNEKRWDLMALLAAASAGFNGGEAMDFYNKLMDSTMTDEEVNSREAEVLAREEEILRQQREERLKSARARKNSDVGRRRITPSLTSE